MPLPTSKLSRFQVLGLTTIIFMIGSLALLSRPLFIPDQKASQVVEADSTQLSGDLDDLLALSEVRQMAQADGPGSQVERIVLKEDDERLYYTAVLADGSLLAYDARSGDSVSTDGMTVESIDSEALPTNFKAVLNFAEARAVGIKQVPHGIVKKIDLHTEDGVVVYDISFKDDERIKVDATTGEVHRSKVPRQDDMREVRGTDDHRERGTDDAPGRSDDKRQDDKSQRPAEPLSTSGVIESTLSGLRNLF